ncbi:MAG: LCP family protein [Actinomycetota bacterium]|nr:LCP family protein [Actinomycetota bacterium]
MSDPSRGDRPEYKVYRSRRKGSLRAGGDGLQSLRERARAPGDRSPRAPQRQRSRRPITPGRVVKWIALAVAGWLLLSLVLFVASAQIEGGVSNDVEDALSGSGNFFSGATVLVLGSDERKGESIDGTQGVPGRADSIMLVRVQLGGVRKLSIPRDASADIPGHGTQKINGAFSIGGPSLMIETVESFMGNGLEIDHLIEVDFEDFPAFIDAMGGITVRNKSKICAPEFDNFFRGFNLKKGERQLDGRRSLGFARVRNNPCAPGETDIDRAARQQEVLNGIRGQLLSPSTFLRLPLVSWKAPKTIETDLRGPGLMALAADIATGGTGETRVLEPAFLGPSELQFSEAEKAAAVRELLGED